MCDTLTREIIAQKNHGNWLILTVIWVSENAATSAHMSTRICPGKRLAAGASPPTPTGGLISPQTPSFLEGGGEGKGRGRGEEGREGEWRGGEGSGGEGEFVQL